MLQPSFGVLKREFHLGWTRLARPIGVRRPNDVLRSPSRTGPCNPVRGGLHRCLFVAKRNRNRRRVRGPRSARRRSLQSYARRVVTALTDIVVMFVTRQ